MPRIRTIKPEFWKEEKVAKRLPGPDGRQARALFIALWNFAEDTGVARGNPAYLRSEIFPYDDDITTRDVSRWLELLERGRFIVRYEREDQTYLWVRGFAKHQRIERPSKPTLPEPTTEEVERALGASSGGIHGALTEDSPSPHRVLTEGSPLERKGREGKGEEGESGRDERAPPPSALQEAWNELALGLPRWKEMPESRAKRARRALRERPMDGPEGWIAVIQRIGASGFCRGQNDRGWVATPDWLLQPEVAAKVLEGKYDNRAGAAAKGRASEADRDWSRPVEVDEAGQVVL